MSAASSADGKVNVSPTLPVPISYVLVSLPVAYLRTATSAPLPTSKSRVTRNLPAGIVKLIAVLFASVTGTVNFWAVSYSEPTRIIQFFRVYPALGSKATVTSSPSCILLKSPEIVFIFVCSMRRLLFSAVIVIGAL